MQIEDFSPAQRNVIDALTHTRDSVLVTGVAGCGKSTIIRHWLASRSADDNARTIVLAPTGIAALNVGGSTIHRAFGFTPAMDVEYPRISLKAKSLLYAIDTIVIDEVSMVRADLLGAMDVVLRSVRRTNTPFGGVRLVMVGDFYQLPPVVREEEERYLEAMHGSREGWCFFAPCFLRLAPRCFFLAESFRSNGDTRYTALLNAIRNCDPNAAHVINELAAGRVLDTQAPRLCSTKKLVAAANAEGLRNAGSPRVSIEPTLHGDVSKIPSEARESIVLAEGARVMITRNGAGYVNGSTGVLTDFDSRAELWDGSIVPAIAVRLDSGARVTVPREEQDVIEYVADPTDPSKIRREVIASYAQFPLALGYAWTIHKSQGQTLDRAIVDLGRGAFAHGQTYVALSRLTSSAGLYLAQPLTRSDLLLDPAVVDFCRKVQS
jgi:hypothetical protein